MKAYCPKCGAVMNARFDGARLVEAECERGHMWLSQVVTEEVSREFFEASESRPVKKPLFSLSSWYCPRDGTQMWQSDRLAYTCPTCGRDLSGGVVQRLIEVHPHSRESE
jgi:hypothetical protein